MELLLNSLKTMMPIVIVESDPNNEIDDEIFIHWALNNMVGYNVYFMCVPGAETRDPEKASLVAIERVNHVRKLFPNQFGHSLTYYANDSDFHLCTNNEMVELLRRRNIDVSLDVEYYIKIAPSWHINPWFYGQLDITTRIVMGDLKSPDASINCTKAMHPTNDKILREEYAAQEHMITAGQTITIPTNFARQIAFTYDIIMSLPRELQVPIVDKWYTQFVARPPAHLPWSCDISIANLMTIKNMFPPDHAKLNDIMENDGRNEVAPEHRMELMVKLDEFLAKAPDMEKTALDKYKSRLLRIALLVEEITGCCYADSEFSITSMSDAAVARENWTAFVHEYKPDATPAYDLLAAVAFKEPESLADVGMCRAAMHRINCGE